MLDGIDLEDKENVASVTSVIKAVLDGVKVRPFVVVEIMCLRYVLPLCPLTPAVLSLSKQELVKLTIEKQEQPSPTTPNKPAPPATTTAERCALQNTNTLIQTAQRSSFTQTAFICVSSMSSEMPLIDREQEVSSKTAPAATPAEAASDIPDEDVAPPKPPLPEAKMAELR